MTAATAVEAAALVGWLDVLTNHATGPRAVAVGVAVLVVGLLAKAVCSHLAANGLRRSAPVGAVALLALVKAGLWVGWLAVAEQVGGPTGSVVAGLALAVLLSPLHAVQNDALRGRPLFSSLFDRSAMWLAAVEATGATLWLALSTDQLRAVAALDAALATDVNSLGATVLGYSLPSGNALVGAILLALALGAKHVLRVRLALAPTGRSRSRRDRTGFGSRSS